MKPVPSRLQFIGFAACLAFEGLAGCALNGGDGTRGGYGDSSEDGYMAPGGSPVPIAPEAKTVWTVPIVQSLLSGEFERNVPAIDGVARTSGIAYVEVSGVGELALIAWGTTLAALRVDDGHVVWKTKALFGATDRAGAAVGLAVDDEAAYVASDAGYVAACALDTGTIRWTACAIGAEAAGIVLRYGWGCVDLIVNDGALYVGFSSFEIEARSYLVRLSCASGATAWRRDLEGWIMQAGGSSYPVGAKGGLLLPVPGGPGIMLIDYGTGEEACRVKTDAMVPMGFTKTSDDVFLTQSRVGTLYRVKVSRDGALEVEQSDGLPDAGGKRLASGARPVVADGLVIGNAPTISEGANALDESIETAAGRVVVFDAGTLALREVRDGRLIESTPVVCGDWLFYRGWSGLYRAPVEFSAAVDFELVSKDVARPVAAWDAALVPAGDDIMLAVRGDNAKKEFVAIHIGA